MLIQGEGPRDRPVAPHIPHRKLHSGNCSVNKNRGCLHYSSPGKKYTEMVGVEGGEGRERESKF